MVGFKLQFLCFTGMLGILTWHSVWAQPNDQQTPGLNHSLISQHAYGPQINLGGFYGSGNSSYGMLDALLPLWQVQRQLLFLDVRGLRREYDQTEINAGLGYRWLSQDFNRLYGLYLFYDRKETQHDLTFQQLTLGAEFKSGRFSFGMNGYIPVGSRKQSYFEVTSQQTFAQPTLQAQSGGYDQILTGQSYGDRYHEIALGGFDGEVGVTLVKSINLRALVGGYYFSAKGAPTVAGPRGTLILNLLSPWTNKSYLKPRLEFESSVQYDKPRGTTWYAGARLSLSFGGAKEQQLTGMQREMTSFVRRDLDVVTEEGVVERTVNYNYYSKSDGTPYRVKVATNEEDLNIATDLEKNIDIIGVDGSVTLAGHNSITSSSKALVNLQPNQILTTGTFSFVDGDVAKSLQIGKSGILKATGNGHLISVSNDATATNTIQNVELIVNDASKYAAITNVTGQLSDYSTEGDHSFSEVTINKVTSNGSLFFSLDQSSEKGSVAAISDNTINLNAEGRYAISLKGFGLQKGQKIDGNTITLTTSQGAGAVHIEKDMAGEISGNVLSFNSVGSSVVGSNAVHVKGKVTGSIDGNRVKINKGASLTNAFYTASLSGLIQNNIITHEGENLTNGFFVAGDVSGQVVKNTLTQTDGTLDKAFYVAKNISSSGQLSDNTLTQTAGTLTDAVHVGGSLTDSAKINTNTLTLGTVSQGIYVAGGVSGSSAEINGNTLTFNSTAVSGIKVDADVVGSVGGSTAETGNTVQINKGASLTNAFYTASLSGLIQNNIITHEGENLANGFFVAGDVSGQVVKNTLTQTDGTLDKAFYVAKNISSSGQLSDNTLTQTAGTLTDAVHVGGSLTDSAKINTNTLTLGTVSQGIYVAGGVSGSSAEINGNTLTFNSTAVSGIKVDADVVGSVGGSTAETGNTVQINKGASLTNAFYVASLSGLMQNNIINHAGDKLTNGFYVAGDVSGQVVKNTLTQTAGTIDKAFYVAKDISSSGQLNHNTVTQTAGTMTDGFYVAEDVYGKVGANNLTLTQATYGISVNGHLAPTASIYNNIITSSGNADTMIRVNKSVAGSITTNTIQQTNGRLEKMISVEEALTGSIDNNPLSYLAPALALSEDLIFIEVSGAVGDSSSQVTASIDGNTLIFNSSVATTKSIRGIVAANSVHQNAAISGNVMDLTANTVGSMAGVLLSGENAVQLYGKVDGNFITLHNTSDNSEVADVLGIASLRLTGTAAATSFSENTISLQAKTASLFGIKFTDETESQASFLGKISSNTISLVSGSSGGSVVDVSAVTLSNMIPNAQITANTITTTHTGPITGTLSGINVLWEDLETLPGGGTYSTPTISENKITTNLSTASMSEGPAGIFGIQFSSLPTNLFMSGSINSNTINVTATNSNSPLHIVGISVQNPRSSGAPGWSLSNNNITVEAPEQAISPLSSGVLIAAETHYNFSGEPNDNMITGNTISMTATTIPDPADHIVGLRIAEDYFANPLSSALTIQDNSFNLTGNNSTPMVGIWGDGYTTGFFNDVTGAGNNNFTFTPLTGDTVEWAPSLDEE